MTAYIAVNAGRAAADRFLDRVPDELRVGLVALADAPHTALRPTQDRDQVQAAIDGLVAEGGTATGDALASALRTLGGRNSNSPPAAIVPLSDGATKTVRDPADVAREAATAGVPVYTVALATSDGQIEANGQVLTVPPIRKPCSTLKSGSKCSPPGASPTSGPEAPAIPTNGDKYPQTANILRSRTPAETTQLPGIWALRPLRRARLKIVVSPVRVRVSPS